VATSIFTSQTPAIAEADDGTDYTLGTAFRRSTSGSITHGRWFFPTNPPTGTTQFVLYNSAGSELSRASFASPTGGQWNTVALPSAVAYTADTLLVASVYTSGRYVATLNFFGSDLVNGDITAPASENGRLGNTDEYPSIVAGSDLCFFADVVFASDAASGAIAVTLPTLTAGATAEASVQVALAATLPQAAAAITGRGVASAAAATTLPALTGAVQATATADGALAVTLPALQAELRQTESQPAGRPLVTETAPRRLTTQTGGWR
jgi:hypothetical protein